MERYLKLQAYLHTGRLDGDIKVEGSILKTETEHSKDPKSELWTVKLVKSEPEDHAEGQVTGLACHLNYTGHH